MVEWLWLLLLGLGTGTFGVMVGTGGGLILVPMLLIFFDMEPAVVAGTSLALVAVTGLSGAVGYRRLGLVDRRSGILFAMAAVPGAVAAPFVVEGVGGGAFRVLFGLLLLGLAAYMLVGSRIGSAAGARSKPLVSVMVTSRSITTGSGETFRYQFNEGLATGFNVIMGFLASFFGTGGGFLRTPVLVAAFGFPVRVAVATSVFALSIYATAGAVVYAYLGHVDWYPTFVGVGMGLLIGSQAGAMLAARLRGLWISRLLVLLLFTMGVRVLVQGMFG